MLHLIIAEKALTQQKPNLVHFFICADFHTSDPLASSKVLCLPRDLHTEVHKVLCLPRDLRMKVRACHEISTSSAGAQPTPGRTSDPLASSKVLRLPRDLRMKLHKVLRLPRNLHIQRRCPADARAYIRPLGKQQSAVPATRCAAPVSGVACETMLCVVCEMLL